MARTASKLKLGYFPLAPEEASRIRRFLQFSGPASVLDPCAGTGAALRTITEGAEVRRYGIELDAHRAAEAKALLHEVVQGSVFETYSPVESYSLLSLNAPYDFEIGEGKNQRLERVFLESTYRWLKPGGVLVMVVPFDKVTLCQTVLSTQFKDKAIYRLTAPEAATYKQVVVLGVRRTRQERDKLTDHTIQQAHYKLNDLTRRYAEIPELPEIPDRMFTVPPSEPAKLEYRGLPLDQVEDLLASSPAWLQARRVTHAPKTGISGHPLTPLHRGHVGILLAGSQLNGRFGRGDGLHLAYWESVKLVDRTEEEGDGGELVIRERERFSQRLTLLYANGHIVLLSEKDKGEETGHAERTSTDGNAEFREAGS